MYDYYLMGLSYYARKTIDRCLSKLIKKQYPGDDFVLDDDKIIVLTKVDIRSSKDLHQTDENDDNEDSILSRWYRTDMCYGESYEYSDDSDMEDFLDDRPEEELTEESDSDSDTDEKRNEEEDKEYDSSPESENSNKNDHENEEDESESEHGRDSDSDDGEIHVSPPKKSKLSIDLESRDDEIESGKKTGFEESIEDGRENEIDENHNDSDNDSDDGKIHVTPRKKQKLFSDSESSDDEESEEETKENEENESQRKNDSDDGEIHDSPPKRTKLSIDLENRDVEVESGKKTGFEESQHESDNDSDDGQIHVTPRKKLKLLSDSESSDDDECENETGFERSNHENEKDENQYEGDAESSDDDNNEVDGISNELREKNQSCEIPNPPSKFETEKHVNTFGVFLLPKIDGKRICLRYHGRIGMEGIKGICRPMQKHKFCKIIGRKRIHDGYTRLNLMYINARHLEHRKSESSLEMPVRKLLIHLIDSWFPLGIPEKIHLDRAKDLLECLKNEISNGKVPSLKYSNKFYELIPHQGDNQRRLPFKDIEYCDSKMEYVKRMESAIECFENAESVRGANPLDYFIEKWLRIELEVLEPEDPIYEILNKVVENTKHSSQPFRTANIFKVDNMNPDMNGDFSTQISTNHRYLLHFTYASNLPCILREGLLPAPKHIHSASRFLGKGIYFWDAIANAGLNYRSMNLVYILVCRVALGKTQEFSQQYLRRHEKLELADGFDSIFCEGQQYPESRNAEEDINGAKIYCGKLREFEHSYWNVHDSYNKYVVHDKNQVEVQYILKLERD